MVTRIRNINALQLGLVYGAISAVGGFIVALFWLSMVGTIGRAPGISAMPFAGIGIMAIVLFPIMYFIIGFIAALITAVIYNLVAGWTGGVEVTLSAPVEAGLPPPAQGYSV